MKSALTETSLADTERPSSQEGFFDRFRRVYRHRLRWLAIFAGPAVFSIRTGHFLSALKRRAVDWHGEPFPWYTFPAIRFLSQYDFSDCTVLEFGGGQSTLWWAKRSKSVLCLDPDRKWVETLRKTVPANVRVEHLGTIDDALKMIGDKTFDIIVADAGTEVEPYEGRVQTAKLAFTHVNDGGIVVMDNSTSDYGLGASVCAGENGIARIDFIGFAPGGVSEYGTSLFFRSIPRFLVTKQPPVVKMNA
jgi:hypothetical protein